MSETMQRRLTGRELERSFILAARRVMPHFTFQTNVVVVPGYSADIVASFADRRIVVECKNVTSTDRILASIYKVTGAINLHPEAFNRAYIVVPDEASKVAGVSIPVRVGIISYTVDALRALMLTGYDVTAILTAYGVVGLIGIVTMEATLYMFRKVVS